MLLPTLGPKREDDDEEARMFFFSFRTHPNATFKDSSFIFIIIDLRL